MHIDLYLRYRTQFGQKLSIKSSQLLSECSKTDIIEMSYFNDDFWKGSLEIDNKDCAFCYQYVLTTDKGEEVTEGEKGRCIDLKKIDEHYLVLVDTWNAAGAVENVFFTAPFKMVFDNKSSGPKLKKSKGATHVFKAKAPILGESECLCILGSDPSLGGWNIEQCFLLEKGDEWHTLKADLSGAEYPVTYKYGIYNFKQDKFVRFETGADRQLVKTTPAQALTILHDGFARFPQNVWRGAGVAIPVFSLRTANGFGVGEFLDIKLLADWAAKTGLKLIQLLPINDTSATFTSRDSYPYAAISAFALHPVYINLQKVAGKKHAPAIKSLQKKQKQLNALSEVDYDQVIHYKMNTLRELYELQGDDYAKDGEYKKFFSSNEYWLKPYAAFCLFRDRNGTADFTTWKTNNVYTASEIDRLTATKSKTARDVQFYYFVQYHLHLQLTEAVEYAHKKGVSLKGDIPIGIFRNSVDAWTAPELYNMNWQAGAPPDDFAVKGQNWGFPTYNWQKMQADGFEWWHQRFAQMKNYFDAFRIDHILGFFRIWSIPMDAVEGILGRFVPALPVTADDFRQRGLDFNYDRLCKPYISDDVVNIIFGADAAAVKETFLVLRESGLFELKEQFNTQQKVEAAFAQGDEVIGGQQVKEGLFDLISNVILFDDPASEGKGFHFRISMEQTTTFQHLDEWSKYLLRDLYVDYFYHRQDEFWRKEAMTKLPALKEATDMLVCGEDLGMVPHSVPGVMSDLGILSLEIQRMPKNPQIEFFHPKDAPYLSVTTPSTHDMSTIRGWWEEDRAKTQKFFNTVLEAPGDAPYFCEPWINRALVLQHLYSPAMLSIFQLQDLLGMSETLRRQDPNEERINIPADPAHYWRYRMHLTLEQLL
ncbi:MAG TPA: 4-alpha-glucanotransferase, partial [Flavisolibacter sp.]|nr:4-alpha-glucanotransferase [Flavisolibacter sp.]